jgi:ribosomal protein L16 Arg81 hydroxylase
LIRQQGERYDVRPGPDQAIASIDDVYDAYASGFTVVVNNLERRWAPLAEFGRDLEQVFRCRVTINVYATPRHAQGFARHFDTHDVFILQIAGDKIWNVSPPVVRLPLAPTPGHTRSTFVTAEPANSEACLVSPGDLLYIPRGGVHDARTEAGSSVHLTVGVHVTRWADLLTDAIRDAAEHDERLREGVPPEWLRGEEPAGNVGARLRELLQRVGDSVAERAAVGHRARQFLAERRPSVESHFRNLDRLHELEPASRVRRRGGAELFVVVEGDRAILEGGGHRVEAPARVAPQFAFVAAHNSFAIADLPGAIDDKGKVVLVRRLVREGLLSVEPPTS